MTIQSLWTTALHAVHPMLLSYALLKKPLHANKQLINLKLKAGHLERFVVPAVYSEK